MNLRTINDVNTFFQSRLVIMEEEYGFFEEGYNHHIESLRYLAEKQAHFRGMAYFDQVEKNAIYLYEAYLAVCQALARYLCEGIPRIEGRQINLFVMGLRAIPQQFGDHQWNYVRFGCNGCPVHGHHQRWNALYRQRRELQHADYVEELEFTVLFYQLRFRLAQHYLTIFLLNQQWAGIARSVHQEEVTRVLQENINFRGDMFSGTFVLRTTGKLTSLKPTWREYWGDQFDEILRQMQ